MAVLDAVHGNFVHRRRVQVLSEALAAVIPSGSTVLDVGTGDGWLAELVAARKSSMTIRGIDTLVRSTARIPVDPFDGCRIPHPDASFDVVMFADVLHHTEDPIVLLREAARVARRAIVIKDHLREGLLAGATLRVMDWVGNARHGVVLPYNYWRHAQWRAAFRDIEWIVAAWRTDLRIYPVPLDWLFGRSLHFVARLEPLGPR